MSIIPYCLGLEKHVIFPKLDTYLTKSSEAQFHGNFPAILARVFTIYCIQLWTFAYVRLVNKPYENEVALKEQKIPLKCCQPLYFTYAF